MWPRCNIVFLCGRKAQASECNTQGSGAIPLAVERDAPKSTSQLHASDALSDALGFGGFQYPIIQTSLGLAKNASATLTFGARSAHIMRIVFGYKFFLRLPARPPPAPPTHLGEGSYLWFCHSDTTPRRVDLSELGAASLGMLIWRALDNGPDRTSLMGRTFRSPHID